MFRSFHRPGFLLTVLFLLIGMSPARPDQGKALTIQVDQKGRISAEGRELDSKNLTERLRSQFQQDPLARLEVMTPLDCPAAAVGDALGAALSGLEGIPLRVEVKPAAATHGRIWVIYRKPMRDPVPPRAPSDKPVYFGGDVQESRLVKRVEPIYPKIARRKRVSGIVLLNLEVNDKGQVAALEPIKGHPWLIAAAIVAVSQWEYTPALLNGSPVPIAATATVNFLPR